MRHEWLPDRGTWGIDKMLEHMLERGLCPLGSFCKLVNLEEGWWAQYTISTPSQILHACMHMPRVLPAGPARSTPAQTHSTRLDAAAKLARRTYRLAVHGVSAWITDRATMANTLADL